MQMRCTKPRTVGFKADGKTLSWSLKTRNPEFATFQVGCGKCIACRLRYASQWAVRCVHEAASHPKSCFITLTYSNEHLQSPWLIYRDWQLFMKSLRRTQNDPISVVVCGEYGEENKRPHWHALLFNYRPSDLLPYRRNERGDQIYTSENLDRLWGKNDPDVKPNEVGDVTVYSAGYCARYSAKKLVHGYDQDHNYHPIFKPSNKHAIGKHWLEKYYEDVFNHGYVTVQKGDQIIKAPIPRYYDKWFLKHHPEKYFRYVTEVKSKNMEQAEAAETKLMDEFYDQWNLRNQQWEEGKRSVVLRPLTPNMKRDVIIESQLKQLQNYLKL